MRLKADTSVPISSSPSASMRCAQWPRATSRVAADNCCSGPVIFLARDNPTQMAAKITTSVTSTIVIT